MAQVQLTDQVFSISAVSYGKITVSATIGSTSTIYAGMLGNIIGPGGAPAGKEFVVLGVDSPGVIEIKASSSSLSSAPGTPFDFAAFNGGTLYIPGQLALAPDFTSVLVPVQSVNSTSNTNISDVIGNKSDDEFGTSIAGKVNGLFEHSHMASKCYPTMASGVTVTKGVGSWVLGAFAVVVPANTITSPFDIHGINFDDITAAGVYELVLYAGPDGSEVEIGRTRCTRTGTTAIATESPFMTVVNLANVQIKAKCAASQAGAGTVVISIRYHHY